MLIKIFCGAIRFELGRTWFSSTGIKWIHVRCLFILCPILMVLFLLFAVVWLQNQLYLPILAAKYVGCIFGVSFPADRF
jgi:hypothetical protein